MILFLPIFVEATDSREPRIRFCGDVKCSVPVSAGRTVLAYNSPDEHIISFKANADVVIYAKTDGDLWEGQIDDRRGQFPKRFVQETKIIRSQLLRVSSETTLENVVVGSRATVAPSDTTGDLEATEIQPSHIPLKSSATDAVWFPESESNSVVPLQSIEVGTDAASLHFEPIMQEDRNDVASNGDRVHVADGVKFTVVDDSGIPPGGLQNSIVVPPMGKTESEIPSSSQTQVDGGLEAETVIRPTPTVSSVRETKTRVGLLDGLFQYVEKELTVYLKGGQDGGAPERVSPRSVSPLPPHPPPPSSSAAKGEQGVEFSRPAISSESTLRADAVGQSAVFLPEVTRTFDVETDVLDEQTGSDIVTARPPNASDPKTAADDWTEVMEHDAGDSDDDDELDEEKVDEEEVDEEEMDEESVNATESDGGHGELTAGTDEVEGEKRYFEVTKTEVSEVDLPNVTDVIQDVDARFPDAAEQVDVLDANLSLEEALHFTVNAENEEKVIPSDSLDSDLRDGGEAIPDSEPFSVGPRVHNESDVADASEPLAADVETMEKPVESSTDYVTAADSHREDPEILVDTHGSVEGDSCDANIFEGNCPGTVAEPGFDGVLDAETPDHPSIASGYVSILKQYVQLVLDYVPEPAHGFLCALDSRAVSPRVVVFTVIVGVFVLVVQIAIAAIKNASKEHGLMTKLCDLDRLHFAVRKERDDLKEELDFIKLVTVDENVEARDAIQTMQSELVAARGDCCRLQEAVERLQEQVDTQRRRMSDLQAVSDAATLENRELSSTLQTEMETVRNLEAELRQNTTRLSHSEAVIGDLQVQLNDRDDSIEGLRNGNARLLGESKTRADGLEILQRQIDAYEIQVKEMADSLDSKSGEVDSLRNCVSKLRRVTREGVKDDEMSTEDVNDVWRSLLDISALKSEMAGVLKERDEFAAKLSSANEAKMNAQALSQQAVEEVEILRRQFDDANRKRDEAVTKLEILSGYFKDKELKLQRELGAQEVVRQQNQENVASVHVKMNSLEQEVQLYRSQMAGLKNEIESQERSYKNQISNQEKKAHENWLAARSAERRLEECKREAASLRNKLTLQEKANGQSETSQVQSKYGSNGEVGHPTSPPLRFAQSDRYDRNVDLPSSSGHSSLYREPLDYRDHPFLPIERPLPPPPPLPFLRGLPPGPPLFLPPPPPLPPFDMDPRGGPTMPPPEHWMRPPSPTSSSASSSLQRYGRYDNRRNRSPPHDGDPREPAHAGDSNAFDRSMPPGVRPPMPRHNLR